ncbi:MAG TPA: AAA family ATPase [Candidatus Woesebacteria bacterium]|nr:AAA family ATPase [Candidatus Woesebacteria bacterium]
MEKTMIEQIKNRVNIFDIAREAGYIPDKNNFIKSIYKEESKPSLKLYPQTNSFYCFSSGNGGDVLRFYQHLKNVDFKTALKQLSERIGIDPIKTEPSINDTLVRYKLKLTESEQESYEERASILQYDFGMQQAEAEQAANNQICFNRISMRKMIYTDLAMHCGKMEAAALDYLTGSTRGLLPDTIKRFGIFYIGNTTKTEKYLRSNYSKEHLTLAGLLNEKGNFVFAMNTLIIPYYENGEIIYLRARSLSNETTAHKYIGLYNATGDLTAKRIFNIDVLDKIGKGDSLLICEGEFDCMIAVQNGYNAIGIPGVHNNPNNLKSIVKDFKITLAFDNDKPGQLGMQTMTDQIGKKVSVLNFKKHKDLTELFINEKIIDLYDNEFVNIGSLKPSNFQKSKLSLITAKKIQDMEFQPIEWIVEKLITPGLIILAGRPKSGKSWLSLNLSLSITRGGIALSYFKAKKAAVLYFALEDNVRRLKARMENILNAEDDKIAPTNLYFLEDDIIFPKLNDGGLDEIQKVLTEYSDIKLVIIDTLGRSRADQKRSDNNIYLADYELLAILQSFALKNKIAILMVHHTKKGSEEYVFDEISGTTGITGAADTMLLLKKVKKQNKLYITGRDIEEAEYNIYFDRDSCTWNVIEETQDAINITVERGEILDLLIAQQRPMRTGEIAQALGKEQSNVSHLLKGLKEDQLVVSPKYGFYQAASTGTDSKTPA